MPSLSSIFHLKNPSHGKDKDEVKNKAEPPPPRAPEQPGPPPYSSTEPSSAPHHVQPNYVQPNYLQPTAPRYAPGTGPIAHGQMVAANNIGMVGGAVLGSALGGSPVGGMIEGQVGATMIMQDVQHVQRQLYYREQALNYRAGLPADGVGAAGGLAPPQQQVGGRDRSRSRSQRRDERRRQRWERRAKRRDGGGAGANEPPSGSDTE
jgi:hypothetical protein